MSLLDRLPARRWCYLAAFAVCAGLMAYALYLQYVKYLEPCPLCMVQRVFIIALGVVFLIAGLHNPGPRGARWYAGVQALLGLSGAAIAARHVWIQYLPDRDVPQCGPGLSYMLDTLPFSQVLTQLMHGSGECHDKSWMFLGLTIPGWTFLFFLSLVLWSLLMTRKTA